MMKLSFEDINSAEGLVSYLKETQRLNNISYFSKYTKLSTVIDMFNSETLFLNNPGHMNDLYEIQSFKSSNVNWSQICFTSFMAQKKESIAMWSMYGQPWRDGVMITIPSSDIKELIHGSNCLISAEYDKDRKCWNPDDDQISGGKISIARVAYVDNGNIVCADKKNSKFKDPYRKNELAGFIKDAAWEYEKEIRLRVDLPSSYSKGSVFLKLSESILKRISITTGPRFNGNVLTLLPEKYRPYVKIKTSKFKEKLAWIPCDNCEYKPDNK